MAKHYEIIAYNYDRYAKGDKFKDKMSVKIPGVEFKSIEDIDRYTAGMSLLDLTSSIGNTIGPRNYLAIRVNDDRGFSYYNKLIFDNKDLIPIIDSIERKTIHTALGYRTIKVINNRNDYFNQQFSIIEQSIEKKKVGYFSTLFNNGNALRFLLERFANSPYDEAFSFETINEMKAAFCDYETFRKFIVDYNKYKHDTFKEKSDTETLTKKENPTKYVGTVTTKPEPFKNPYMKDDDLQEEFLDDDEIFEMSGFDEEATPIYYTGKKR